MKTIFPALSLFGLVLSGCLADLPPGWGTYGGYGGEREARNTCVDRAQQTGHRVDGVRSVGRDGSDITESD
jgi:hypothetical protein